MGARVLLAGMGAREHAIAWKLRQSPDVDAIYVAPGNAGTARVATNVPVSPRDIDGLVDAARDLRIDFYLATMDDPQPLGLVDRLRERGLPCYGPTAAAAAIEASKAWAKQFMADHGIATAPFRVFRDHAEAAAYVSGRAEGPLVVKASGLAAGKGALVCDDREGALAALHAIMVQREFGEAGDEVVVEERLRGWETSAHAICDGHTAVLTPSATDYKRALDGGGGLNTGGMGAVSPGLNLGATGSGLDVGAVGPGLDLTPALTDAIEREVVAPTIAGMAAAGRPYTGTLYPGLMITPDGMRVLEFNARFGDPEAQVLMARLKSDLFAVCRAAAEGKLAGTPIEWSDEHAVGVVLASGGYPGPYATGHRIEGLDDVDTDALVFHAGTKDANGGVVTNGGRVLTVVARAPTLIQARERAYANARRIRFEGAFMRTDIAAKYGPQT